MSTNNVFVPVSKMTLSGTLKAIPPAEFQSTVTPDRSPASLRLLLLGVHSSGKTSFMQSRPRTFIASVECSSKYVRGAKAEDIPNYERWAQFLTSLCDKVTGPKYRAMYDCIGIDTGGLLCNLIENNLIDEALKNPANTGKVMHDVKDAKAQSGYSLIAKEMLDTLKLLETLGYSWMISDHFAIKTVKDSAGDEIEKIRPIMYPTTTAVISRMADFVVGFYPSTSTMNVKDAVTGRMSPQTVKKVKLVATQRVHSDLKDRVVLPESIEIPKYGGWEVFAKVYEEALAREDQEYLDYLALKGGAPQPTPETK